MKGHRGKAGYWIGMVLMVLGLGSCPASAEPVPAGLSRVELGVTDLEASIRFYGRLFGGEAWQLSPDGRAWLPVGSAYLVLRQAGAASIRLTGFAVDDFDADQLRDYLLSQRLRPELDGEGLLSVRDRDGVVSALTDRQPPRVSLARHAVSATPQDGIFNALIFDEVHLMVGNMEVDSLFYSRLLGRTASQQAGSLWYDLGQGRLRLSQTPPGQEAGVNYFAVLVANTDMELASERVFAAGGLVETLLPNGFSFWDPDGLRVLVRTTSQH